MASTGNKTIYCIGSGPGIGRSVTTLWASKGYTHVALFARKADQLKVEAEALEKAVGGHGQLKVQTYAVDVVDTANFSKALDAAEQAVGKPDCVFYNAARVLPSELLSHQVSEMEYDFKINVSALYVVAQKFMPHLQQLAKSDASGHPALIVTSSLLPHHPIPQLFVLSLVKAAQRNMLQSMHMTYGPEGVFVGVINVQGQVSPDSEKQNPTNIANKTWEWYSGSHKGKHGFEVVV